MGKRGKLYGVGLGPGDPDLITLKALKAIEASDIIAYHQARGKKSNALRIAEGFLHPRQKHLPLVYPLTTELVSQAAYDAALAAFYQQITAQIAALLDHGQTVSVLAAGDPLLYSSFMHIHDRLGDKYDTTIIPGVTSISGAAAALKLPLCYHDQNFTILSGALGKAALRQQLLCGDAFAIIKLGRHFAKVRRLLHETGLAARARYIERVGMEKQKIIALDEIDAEQVPYFSIILVGGGREAKD